MASLRRLALHASALSDAEYELYTSSLKDIALGDEDEDEQGGNSKAVGGSGKSKGGAARTGGVGHGPGQGNEGDSDAYFEDMKIGVREVRAWLRGRYSHVPSSAIDKILRLFSPTIAHGDVLSGSEFFAALRLVVHAENGQDVERSLAFVQAVPLPRVSPGAVPVSVAGTTASTTHTTPSTSRTSSPSKRHADLPPPPPPPSRRPTSTSATATMTASGSSHNPFAQANQHSSHSHPQPPLHPSQRSESSKSTPSAAVAASTSQQQQHATHNPFVSHHRPPPPSAPLPQTQTHSQFQSQQQQPPVKSTRSDDGRIPPLPPRKPPPPPPPLPQTQGQGALTSTGSHIVPLVPPPQHVSSRNRERVERSISPAKVGIARPVPHPPLTQPQPLGLSSHVTSTLMKQSLHASKVAQTMKKAEEMLEKERVMQVLKRSGGGSGNAHQPNQYQQLRSESPAKMYASSASASSNDERDRERGRERQAPPLPRRRTQTQTQAQYVYPDEGKDKAGRQRQTDLVPPPPSPPMSASSMEQVALAHVNPRAHHSQSLSDPFGVNNPGANSGASPFRSPADPLPSRLQQQQHSTLNTDHDAPHSPLSERVTEKEKERGREGLYSRYSTPSGSSSTSSSRAGSRVRGQVRSMSMSMGVGVSANHGSIDSQHQPQQQYPPPTHPDRKPPAHLGHDMVPGSSASSSPSPNGMASYPRVFRSRSMHQTSPTASPGKGSASGTTTGSGSAAGAASSPAPPPPVRRRRPESVQVLPGSSSNLNLYQAYQQYQPPPPHPPSPNKSGFGLGRHATVSSSSPAAGRRRSSLSTAVPTGPWGRDGERDTDRGGDEYGYDTHSTPGALHAANANTNANTNATDSPLSTIRRSIEPILDNLNNLNRSIAADFDRARYKAEAGLSRRGFVRDGAVGHVHVGKRGEEEREEEEGLMRAPVGAGAERGRGRDRGRVGRGHPVAGDNDDGRPGMDVDSPSVDGSSGQEGDGSEEGDESERWRKSRGMGLGVGKVPSRNVFEKRQELLEKDNLKWPAGEGWKPL